MQTGFAVFSLVIFAVTMVFALQATGRYLARIYLTPWFDHSKNEPGRDASWWEIRSLMRDDPLQHRREFRLPLFRALRDLLLFDLFLMFLFGLGNLWADVRLSIDFAKAESLAIMLGGLSVPVAAFGLFLQVRLKARAENRQAWINTLRDDLNKIISKFPGKGSTKKELAKASKRYDPLHTRIELFLNPSERVHRSLMTIIRKFYGIEDLSIDKEPRLMLHLDIYNIWENDEDWDKLKSGALRLASALLKREWEQVKHVR